MRKEPRCRAGSRLLFVLKMVIGVVMLVTGAELLVRGGSHIALVLRVPILIVGLTLVAFGTSTPELAVSVTAALTATTEMALGNVNGSNIANILLVLGVAAAVSPLRVDRRLMRREVPTLLALQLAVPLMCIGGTISRLEGGLLLLGGLGYNAWLLYDAMAMRQAYEPDDDVDLDVGNVNLPIDLAMLVGGLVILLIGAMIFVDGSTAFAKWMGLSDWFISLTILALGTSMPEVVTSIVSSYRGQVDLAIGNSLGSNILNISMVLGITALIQPIQLEDPSVWSTNLITVGVAVLLIPIVMSGSGRLSRAQGVLMMVGYVAVLAFIAS